MNEFEQLQMRFFDGELSPEEASDLARKIENDPDAAREFLSLYTLDRLLALRAAGPRTDAAAAVLQQIRREQTPFVRRVLREIKSDAEPAGPRRFNFARWLESWLAHPRWIVAGAALLLAVALAGWLFPPQGDPIVSSADKSQIYSPGQAAGSEAQAGQPLALSAVLKTENGGAASITFGREATRLDLGESTVLKLASLAEGKRFVLSNGVVEATVARQPPFQPLFIDTPQAKIQVRGTRFTLEALPGQTRLDVSEGRVRLIRANDGSYSDIDAGQYGLVFAAATGPVNALPKTGTITRQWWNNVSWQQTADSLADPRFPAKPDGTDQFDRFELEPVLTNRFGMRLVGYLHPPVTGEYEFWLAASNEGQLYLSENEEPSRKVALAVVGFRPDPRQWDGKPSNDAHAQRSGAIHLEAGRRYYIEAIVVVPPRIPGHLSVAWKRPDAPRELLSGRFLSPLESKR